MSFITCRSPEGTKARSGTCFVKTLGRKALRLHCTAGKSAEHPDHKQRTMDEMRNGQPHGTVISFLVAALSLGITVYTTWRNRTPVEPVSPVSLFNVVSGEGLSTIAAMVLDKDARTNRTVWETVDTSELHAGLERIEVAAWIPPHSHSTEEIVVVCAGSGLVYDFHGHSKPMEVGAMVHIAANSRHAFRNIGEEPLLIAWLFPSMFASNKFEFRQRYKPS